MSAKKILVTGANGQLGNEFRRLAKEYPQYEFLFAGRAELPIENATAVITYFQKYKPAICINCAAYTAVDKAETEREQSNLANAQAPAILAAACKENQTHFFHISTDYVFDGNSSVPYKESDDTSPVNHYGATKLKGEQAAIHNNPRSIIIRTSWVYSEYGNNFVKTMIRLMKEKTSINVVSDQVGSPTYAADLATAVMKMVETLERRWPLDADRWIGFDEMISAESFSTTARSISPIVGGDLSSYPSGIYHYSNEGSISWHEFATAIKEMTGSECIVNAIPTTQYPTPARRPRFSLLDKSKIKSVFGIEIPQWRESLERCLQRIRSQESGVRSQNS